MGLILCYFGEEGPSKAPGSVRLREPHAWEASSLPWWDEARHSQRRSSYDEARRGCFDYGLSSRFSRRQIPVKHAHQGRSTQLRPEKGRNVGENPHSGVQWQNTQAGHGNGAPGYGFLPYCRSAAGTIRRRKKLPANHGLRCLSAQYHVPLTMTGPEPWLLLLWPACKVQVVRAPFFAQGY